MGVRVREASETLEKLLQLQEKDRVLDEYSERMKKIPLEIASLKGKSQKIREEVKAKEDEIQTKDKKLKAYLYEIEDIEGQIKGFESDRLKVKTNEEYRALEKEIKSSKEKKVNLEEEAISLMEELEEKKERMEEFKRKAEQEIEQINSEIEQKKQDFTRIKEEIPIKNDERLRASKQVPEDELNLYERIRNIKGGVVVFPIINSACGGCHAFVSTQKQDRLRKTSGIDLCENCGQIIYISDEYEEES